jgi:hypothetical protein
MVWLVGASLRVTGHKVQAAGLELEAMCAPIIYLFIDPWSLAGLVAPKMKVRCEA